MKGWFGGVCQPSGVAGSRSREKSIRVGLETGKSSVGTSQLEGNEVLPVVAQ